VNLKELREKLEGLDIPVQYRAFKEGAAPPLPYLIFYVEDNDGTLKADNHNYFKVKNVTLELYSEEKDLDLEEALESILDENKIEYDLAETYIESEEMFENIYEITL
jgi:hypothetical protein